MANVLVINASRAGEAGNSHVLGQLALRHLPNAVSIVLKDRLDPAGIEGTLDLIAKSSGILILTGTHWDSWSGVLQQFLETVTSSEGTSTWLGKPVAIIVSEHGTGGKGVLSRLQGVFVTFGCLIPPMSGLVYSRTGQNTVEGDHPGAEDVWCKDDIAIVCANLVAATKLRAEWKTWPVDRKDFEKVWVD